MKPKTRSCVCTLIEKSTRPSCVPSFPVATGTPARIGGRSMSFKARKKPIYDWVVVETREIVSNQYVSSKVLDNRSYAPSIYSYDGID
jgi:hypothetical protein